MKDVQLTVRISEMLAKRLDAHLDRNPAFSRSSVVVRALDAFLPALPDSTSKKGRRSAAPGAGQDRESGQEGYEFGVRNSLMTVLPQSEPPEDEIPNGGVSIRCLSESKPSFALTLRTTRISNSGRSLPRSGEEMLARLQLATSCMVS